MQNQSCTKILQIMKFYKILPKLRRKKWHLLFLTHRVYIQICWHRNLSRSLSSFNWSDVLQIRNSKL